MSDYLTFNDVQLNMQSSHYSGRELLLGDGYPERIISLTVFMSYFCDVSTMSSLSE